MKDKDEDEELQRDIERDVRRLREFSTFGKVLRC